MIAMVWPLPSPVTAPSRIESAPYAWRSCAGVMPYGEALPALGVAADPAGISTWYCVYADPATERCLRSLAGVCTVPLSNPLADISCRPSSDSTNNGPVLRCFFMVEFARGRIGHAAGVTNV